METTKHRILIEHINPLIPTFIDEYKRKDYSDTVDAIMEALKDQQDYRDNDHESRHVEFNGKTTPLNLACLLGIQMSLNTMRMAEHVDIILSQKSHLSLSNAERKFVIEEAMDNFEDDAASYYYDYIRQTEDDMVDFKFCYYESLGDDESGDDSINIQIINSPQLNVLAKDFEDTVCLYFNIVLTKEERGALLW